MDAMAQTFGEKMLRRRNFSRSGFLLPMACRHRIDLAPPAELMKQAQGELGEGIGLREFQVFFVSVREIADVEKLLGCFQFGGKVFRRAWGSGAYKTQRPRQQQRR